MRRKMRDLGRERIIGFTKVDDKIYLDFFTDKGLKVILLMDYEFNYMLDFLNKCKEDASSEEGE